MKTSQQYTRTLLALLMCLLFAGKSVAQESGKNPPPFPPPPTIPEIILIWPFENCEKYSELLVYENTGSSDLSTGIRLCVSGDYETAVPCLQRAAKQGEGLAMAVLGDLYARGRGVKADRLIAMNMFDKGVQAQCAMAYCYRGDLYQEEEKKDLADTEYRKAYKMDSNCTYALRREAELLWNDKNYEESMRFMETVYQSGESDVAGDLGATYAAEDWGIPVNYEKAFDYLTKEDARYNMSQRLLLAELLYYGRGTGEDADKKMQKKSNKYKSYYYKKGESGLACITDALIVLEELMGENYEPAKELYHTVKSEHDERERLSNILEPPTFTDEGTRYFQRATIPRPPAIETAGHGEIVIRARISTSGYVQSVTLAERVLQRLDEEALKLVRNMPPMNPGTKGGFPTEMYVNIVVRYFPYYKVSMRGYSVVR